MKTNIDYYFFSAKTNDSVKHWRIHPYSILGTPLYLTNCRKLFQDLASIVEHFKDNPLPGTTTKLTYAAPRGAWDK